MTARAGRPIKEGGQFKIIIPEEGAPASRKLGDKFFLHTLLLSFIMNVAQ